MTIASGRGALRPGTGRTAGPGSVGADEKPRPLERSAWRRASVVAGAVSAVGVALSGRYGYHRDELYFLAAGRHPTFGYPDQPPLVPLLARATSALAPGSLVVLRLPAVLATGVVVVLTAALARQLGAGRGAQVLAAAVMGAAPVLLGMGHQLSTATFDLLVWAVLLWLVVRILRTGEQRRWLAVGVVAGVGLQLNTLVVFLLGALAVGLAVAGPRRTLRSPWLWAGATVALLLWAPYLAWQARHGWPQLAVADAIAAGRSGSSAPRLMLLPYQLGLVSVWLAPVWIVGQVRLLRAPELRWCRALGWAWPVCTAVFIATGGKPYYLAGLYPLLLAAGAQPAVEWLRRGRRRTAALAAAFVLGLPGLVVALPVLPARSFGELGMARLDYDLGEQIGWPSYVGEIAAVYHDQPADRRPAALVTANYGEAAAIDRYGPAFRLPRAYSGQTGYWYWGPPPAVDTVIAVGFDLDFLQTAFDRCRLATRLHNGARVRNDEQGRPVFVCTGQRAPWATLWPRFRRS